MTQFEKGDVLIIIVSFLGVARVVYENFSTSGCFFWNITVSVFLRVVDVVLNLSFFLRRCFGKAQSSTDLLVAPLKQVARPAGTNIHDARWPNRDDLCEARIQIHGWPQKRDSTPPKNGSTIPRMELYVRWAGKRGGISLRNKTPRVENLGGIFLKNQGGICFFQSNHTYPEEKKGRLLQIDNCVFFFWFPQRLEWSLHILPFPKINEKNHLYKLKTQLMFTVKNLVLIKFISLWDISFDFFSNHLNTQLPGNPSDLRFDYKRPWNFEGPTPPKTKGHMGTPGRQSAQPTNWATNRMRRNHEITLLQGGPKNQLKGRW